MVDFGLAARGRRKPCSLTRQGKGPAAPDLDWLRVSGIAGMFDAIEEFNDIIATERVSGDPSGVASVRYRHLVGPATLHRIRATVQHALNIVIRLSGSYGRVTTAMTSPEMMPRCRLGDCLGL
ncbi:hypothetical protein [Nonomuraea bangladeshensis]|uniref:hypothetical protein n=1 Tax=Nonomuraea bangladeshensis TaxID=404385 RepID=UPI003C2E869F